MNTKRFLHHLCFCVFLLVNTSAADDPDSAIFSVPDILRDNVAFWKKVYTEYSLHEGVIHDRDYPLVIYKKISVDQMSGWTYSRFTEGQKTHIANCLKNLETQPESTWTDEEKAYLAIYKEHAPEATLSGASGRVRFQLGQKERFRMGLESSTAYLDTIRTIFSGYHVPQRLAYLPHVESSFNLESYSKVGAAGVWQFMRSTGRMFLRINYLIDERRDPILSTVAAAKLLKSNYQELGAWPLAITAYNHGVNGMKHAVAMTGSRDISVIIKNYASPSFQFASKNFYACFLAASDIAMHATENFSDLHCSKKIEFKNVKLPSYMRPGVLCKYLNVPQDVLREFNPALRPVVFNQQKQLPADYEIRVPKDISSGSMERQLASIPDSLKSNEPERSGYYTVQQGDNLYGIASRFSVSLAQLTEENNINRKNRIFEGQVLRIPQTAKAVDVAAAPGASLEPTLSQESPIPVEKPLESTSTLQQPVTNPDLVAAVHPSPNQAVQAMKNAQKPFAPASPWETANYPAKKKTPPIAALPSIPPAALSHANQPVVSPLPISSLSDSIKEIALASADTAPQTPRWSKPNVFSKFDVDIYNLEMMISPDGQTAQIRASVDETIGHYADWLGLPTHRIRQINHMGGRSDIRINSLIKIPAEQPMLDRMVKTRLEYHMAIEEDFYGMYKVTDVKQKNVKRGENLWDLCNSQDIPLWLFKKYNKQLDLNELMPGVLVWIPVVEEKTEQELREESNSQGGIYPAYQSPHEIAKCRGFYRMP
jgi:membrane-bound lytic murein transglycosylase D